MLAASLVPSLILGLISGAFIDRYDRKKIIILTDLLRGVALLFFSILFYQGMQSISLIISVQIILSLNSAFFECFISIPKHRLPSAVQTFSLYREISNGYRYIFSRSNLLILLFLVMLIHFFVGANSVHAADRQCFIW